MCRFQQTYEERFTMQITKVIDLITDWLSTYCENAGMDGFVIGVSGGIDSAVTSALCAQTEKNLLLLNIPIYQAEDQISLSDQHIQWLEARYDHVKGITVDLTAPFQALEKILPEGIQDDLAMANTRSRLRMLTLHAFASHHRRLVVGTGNKVEDFGVGFYTKYGDGGVDISPIADLMKSEVYTIGRELGIIDAIMKAPPTDGLWEDNRSDESQIGATYAELEWAMDYASEPSDENVLTDRQTQVLAIYRRFHRANKHKMEPIPVFTVPDELR
jgi:NAD+ synthase